MRNIITMTLLTMFLTGCQSGCSSRYTGGTTKLPLPANVETVVGFAKDKNKKLLTYIGADGKLYVKEYSDIGIFEATYEFTGATFDKDGNKVK